MHHRMSKTGAVKIGEAARIIGVSPSTIRAWDKLGIIRPLRTVGGTRLFDLKEIEKLAYIVSARKTGKHLSELLAESENSRDNTLGFTTQETKGSARLIADLLSAASHIFVKRPIATIVLDNKLRFYNVNAQAKALLHISNDSDIIGKYLKDVDLHLPNTSVQFNKLILAAVRRRNETKRPKWKVPYDIVVYPFTASSRTRAGWIVEVLPAALNKSFSSIDSGITHTRGI